MAKYVVFLRGVNVGGVKVLMKDLTALFQGAGYQEVKTLLASGNVVLTSKATDALKVQLHCDELLAAHYQRSIPTLVYPASEVAELAVGFPEYTAPSQGEFHRYLTLCASAKDAHELSTAATALDPDAFNSVVGRAFCWIAPKGQSTDVPLAKLMATQARKRLITTRNLNTFVKLSTIISSGASDE